MTLFTVSLPIELYHSTDTGLPVDTGLRALTICVTGMIDRNMAEQTGRQPFGSTYQSVGVCFGGQETPGRAQNAPGTTAMDQA